MDSLVSTEWLEAELSAPELRLIDATTFLPGSDRDAGQSESPACSA